ncbi:conserved hypothetical protein [Bradyrhizobium sp. ORS 285]|uniref:hypothetical protein n=1 Tax=Bradyrhizobium sp. ORS 285 TaxID=115808 RepID=UPI000240574C|nr:hypothetical protein [Bradyrhizobium sp. ORS 285]CCD90031.1 conserved hypothetical protein [Bradyrhizobium sp. ORS 285]SMX56226.1 conserved hypothetical protein [Bradyrhizobium sp. ORS 285]
MTEQRPEFGKRRPLPPPPPTPPVKRSGHVALLLMGTLAVGGTAYTLMPRQQSCPQEAETPTMAAPPQTSECSTRRSSSSGGGGSGSGRWGFSSGDSDSRGSGSSHVAEASSSHVSRGGFGGFGHGFGGGS